MLESGAVAESMLVHGFSAESEHAFGGITMRSHGRAAYFVHTTGEVVRMLDAAGFAHVELRGDDGPYELGASRMIAVAV